MKLKVLIRILEELAPPALQESYDNSGLIVGNEDWELSSALLCLDSLEEVVDEAIQLNSNLIIAHHPIVFSGLKSLTGKNYIERVILKAIKNDIAIYSIHTNLDNVKHGVNEEISRRIGLKNLEILSSKKQQLFKMVCFCPEMSSEKVREAIFEAGGGVIGKYDCCSFNVSGVGTFRAGENSEPFVGKKGELHAEDEVRIETVLPKYILNKVLEAMIKAHPYEEVAYDVYALENNWKEVGSGMVGELEKPIETLTFLDQLKSTFKVECLRHTAIHKKEVQRIAFCGGSGSFLLGAAKSVKADVFITADYKYHQFFDADGEIIIADIGHFESEQFTPHLIQGLLKEKIPNFATYLSKVKTNPINYR